jgi:hypothetical protein
MTPRLAQCSESPSLASRLTGALLLAVSALTALSSCDDDAGGLDVPTPTERSPNAELKPAPLASAGTLIPKRRGGTSQTGASFRDPALKTIEPSPEPEPEPWDPNEPVSAPEPLSRDDRGYVFESVLHSPSLGEPIRGEGFLQEPHTAMADEQSARLSIELWRHGEMRLTFEGPSQAVPRGTRLLASSRHYGHVLVWPDRKTYRVLGVGTLRNLLAERRPDASPTVVGTVTEAEPGRRLGFVTHRQTIETPTGTLTLEQAVIEDLGESAPLVCRLLTELVLVEASTEVCVPGAMPLYAHYSWKEGGQLSFEVETLARRREGSRPMALPPSNARFVRSGLPRFRAEFASRERLATLREPSAAGLAELQVTNYTPWLTFVLVDGLSVAGVLPEQKLTIEGLPKGQYAVGFRTFLGRVVSGNELMELPKEKVLGTSPEEKRQKRRRAVE